MLWQPQTVEPTIKFSPNRLYIFLRIYYGRVVGNLFDEQFIKHNTRIKSITPGGPGCLAVGPIKKRETLQALAPILVPLLKQAVIYKPFWGLPMIEGTKISPHHQTKNILSPVKGTLDAGSSS
jgi:hypothetical protein